MSLDGVPASNYINANFIDVSQIIFISSNVLVFARKSSNGDCQ